MQIQLNVKAYFFNVFETFWSQCETLKATASCSFLIESRFACFQLLHSTIARISVWSFSQSHLTVVTSVGTLIAVSTSQWRPMRTSYVVRGPQTIQSERWPCTIYLELSTHLPTLRLLLKMPRHDLRSVECIHTRELCLLKKISSFLRHRQMDLTHKHFSIELERNKSTLPNLSMFILPDQVLWGITLLRRKSNL